MFLDKRVYQGSSGKVYPKPFYRPYLRPQVRLTVSGDFLENEFIRIMILPEIGGRIHIGLDKTNNYDFFYRQNVIKPRSSACWGLGFPAVWSSQLAATPPTFHIYARDHQIESHEDGSVHGVAQRTRTNGTG